MIQRIQTVYLAIALILLGLMAWLPFAEIALTDQVYTFSARGIIDESTGQALQNGIPIMTFLSIVLILQIIIIFGYKKRVRQMRMATYNIILMLGIVGICAYFRYASFKDLAVETVTYKIALVFPIVAAILNYLAIRAIGKDEALVRSIDRIR